MTADAVGTVDLPGRVRLDPKWATPGAVQVLPADAPRDRWLTERRRGIGGSDASTVADLNPYSSRYALYLDKIGEAREREQTPAMEWGHRLEPVLREYAAEKIGVPFHRRGLLRSRTHAHMQFTPDGLGGDGSVLELKTTSWRTEDAEIWRSGEVPDHAELQAQHGLYVTGRPFCWVVGLIDGREPFIVRVDADHELQAQLVEMEHRFWHDHVLAGKAPPADGSGATTDAIRDRYNQADDAATIAAGNEVLTLLDERATAQQTARDAAERAEEITNRLKLLAGTAEIVNVTGEPAFTWRQNGTFSEKALAAAEPDVHADYLTGDPRFDLARFKAEQPDRYRAHRGRRFHVPKRKTTPTA